MAGARHRFALPVIAVLAILAPPAGAEPGAARLVGPFTRDDYPQAIIDRPLTLPAGMIEAEIGAQFTSLRFETPVFGVGGTDDWDGDLAVRVGVTDRIQLEAGTAFSLDHTLRDEQGFQGVPGFDVRPSLTSWRRIVPVRLSLLALDTETLDTAVTLTLPFVAHASRTFFLGRSGEKVVTFANGDGRVLPEVDLAAPTRWRLTDWLWLRAGENLFAVTTGDGIAQFAFDLGVGVQPHRLFAVTLDSRMASIAFDGGGHETSQTLADAGTIELTGFFTPLRNVDVVGSLGLPNVGRGFDDYVTRIAVRARI